MSTLCLYATAAMAQPVPLWSTDESEVVPFAATYASSAATLLEAGDGLLVAAESTRAGYAATLRLTPKGIADRNQFGTPPFSASPSYGASLGVYQVLATQGEAVLVEMAERGGGSSNPRPLLVMLDSAGAVRWWLSRAVMEARSLPNGDVIVHARHQILRLRGSDGSLLWARHLLELRPDAVESDYVLPQVIGSQLTIGVTFTDRPNLDPLYPAPMYVSLDLATGATRWQRTREDNANRAFQKCGNVDVGGDPVYAWFEQVDSAQLDVVFERRSAQDGWTAVIAQLCESPDAFIAGLEGRFALLWIDLAKGRLGLASDRFNTYGFCYASEGRRLSFAEKANEVPALRREIDRQGVFDYLYFHAILAPGTIFKDIFRLEPGSRLNADKERTQLVVWWQPRFEEPASADFGSSAATFKTLIKSAVERELDGASVGAFLSGGTDSSTVVGMLAKSGNPVTAYSIGFEAEGYDEMEFAKIAAKHFGVKHVPYYITSDDLVANIPSVAASYDQPFGNSSVLPAYLCAMLAHDDGHRKMFAGDGGDELSGGNTRYAKQRVFSYYENVPGLIKSALLEPVIMQTKKKVAG